MRNFIFQAFETEGHNGFCNAKGFRQCTKSCQVCNCENRSLMRGKRKRAGSRSSAAPSFACHSRKRSWFGRARSKQLKDFAGPSRWSVTWISSWPQVKLFSRQERFPLSRIISGPPSVERQEIPFSPGVLKGGNPRARFGRFSHKEMRSKGPFFSEILH